MRVAPPCRVVLRRFTVWRSGVVVLGSAALAALLAWWHAAPQAEAPAVRVALVFGAAAVVLVAMSLWRIGAGELSWDEGGWRFAPADPRRSNGAVAGTVLVAIDLGPFLLLRFLPEDGSSPRWLPAQRSGLEADWHGLRCAAYAPRRAAAASRPPGAEAR